MTASRKIDQAMTKLLSEPVSSRETLDDSYHILPMDEEYPKNLTFRVTLPKNGVGK